MALQHTAAHDPAHAEEHHTSTGIDNRKLFMWLFLGSDCLFFGSLIATYMLYRGRDEAFGNPGPRPHEIFDIPFTSMTAFVLVVSSMTMVLALSAIQRGDIYRTKVWLAATALLGLLFISGQAYEFTHFYHEGLGLSTNLFGSSFYVMTGFHGAHVGIGVLMLMSLFVLAAQGRLRRENALNVELVGLYWHFVDIVWVAIFTLVYLLP